ncbi:MAG: DUF1957 domain-containing protein [Treponema sp.]|nr:DUF1957 domain-containing protein [Treponema sp.]
MDGKYAISLVLNAHLPYLRKFTAPPRRSAGVQESPASGEHAQAAGECFPLDDDRSGDFADFHAGSGGLAPDTAEESWFFESLSETWLPLLEVFDRLEGDHVPFRVGISISPIFAQMLCDDLLLEKYTAFLDHQIDFGRQEMERLKDDDELCRLAQSYFDRAVERRTAFAVRYDGSITKALDAYRRKGKVEFLATTATHSFLPFLCDYPESVQAQMESALAYYRYSLGIYPQGFWLPELGWTKELEPYLCSYGFNYTIADSHGFIFGNPPPVRGTFYPVKTPQGLFVLARDFNASSDIAMMQKDGCFRDNSRDIGYELPPQMLGMFLARNGARIGTGYQYWNAAGGRYDSDAAGAASAEYARVFLENCFGRLAEAAKYMEEIPLSLCAFNADSFGRHWHEGPQFLESMFRLAAGYREIQFMTPSEYLCHQQISAFEKSIPEFSSWGDNGYAEVWLDSSSDWIYRCLNRSIDRMVELAERFSENSGLKERALNQAAREILLAQASDWPELLYRQKCTEYAKFQIENSLQNFTTIYEALGSSHISTEWLTSLERQHNVFPNINYRVFRRKR